MPVHPPLDRSDLTTAPLVRPTHDWATIRTFTHRHSVMLACLATLSVHLLSLTRQLGSDEGGFAMLARHWRDGGSFLYGPEWVDRPPGLIALFDVAQRLGPYGVRLTAAVVAVVLVAALAWAGDAVGGSPAARWAAWAGFAFGSSVLLGSQQLNGELAAAAFVAISIASLLRAVRVSTTRAHTVLLGLLAGGSATMAVLMKQNFIDAFVFGAVLLTVGAASRGNRLTCRLGIVMAATPAFVVGAVVPVLVTLWWATGHGGLGALAYAVVGFRTDASEVMASGSWAAPLYRLENLGRVGLSSGLLFLVAHLAFSNRRRLRRLDPLAWAIASTAAVELLGVFAGENFWPHYLIALIPTVALTAGLSANHRAPGWRWTQGLVVAAVMITAVASPVAAISAAGASSAPYTVGRWVAASAQPGDTIVVPYTHPNVINASGLTPAYPYVWSLPTRTLDPDLSMLTSVLTGRDAPTWVVGWDDVHSWGLDADDRVDAALRSHYRQVSEVCGKPVWLHTGVSRVPAAIPPTSACGVGPQ